MTTGSFLPALSVTPAYLGTYDANRFPSPLKTAAMSMAGFPINTTVITEEVDPKTR
jgi:hypothetical protein